MSAAKLAQAQALDLLIHARGQRDVLHAQLQTVLPLLKQLQDEPTEDPNPLHHLVRDVTDAIVAVTNQRLRETAVEGLSEPAFCLVQHLHRQIAWSARTFGPGERTEGVCDHIRKELIEVQDDAGAGLPALGEWVDVIILAMDGAWRSGATPEQIVAAIVAKQTKNEGRRWPDWRTADPGKAIEHDRTADAAPGP